MYVCLCWYVNLPNVGRIRATQLDYSEAHRHLLQVHNYKVRSALQNTLFLCIIVTFPFPSGNQESPTVLSHLVQADCSQVYSGRPATPGGNPRSCHIPRSHSQETSCSIPLAHSRWVEICKHTYQCLWLR